MKLSIFHCLVGFIAAAQATEWVEKRQVTSLDMASIDSQIASLTQLFGAAPTNFSVSFVSTPGGNLLAPPQTLIGAIITAVPATVLAELLNPTARSSIASEIKAGNTPDWYAGLPTAVKSYVGALNAQITGGSVSLTAAADAKTTLPVSSGALNSAIASGSNLNTEFSFASDQGTAEATGDIATSTSKALAAGPVPTGGLTGSIAGAVGALGVVLFL